MFRRVGRSSLFNRAIGASIHAWLRLVKATTRFVEEPPGLVSDKHVTGSFIFATWHGNHFMTPFMNVTGARYRAIVSLSADGDIIAAVLERFGIEQVRGSGGKPTKQLKKGGAKALRALIDSLDEGYNVAITADVPREGGIAGAGIVTLARLSGRPIIAMGLATSRFIRFDNWDRAVVNLPFARGAMVVGDVIYVPRDASEAELEEKRLEVQAALDRVNERAYALVGRQFRSSRR